MHLHSAHRSHDRKVVLSLHVTRQRCAGNLIPCMGSNIVHEWPKPKYPLRDLVKLWQEAKQREEEAHRCAEHWHCNYSSLNQEYLALKDGDLCLSCQGVKDETETGKTVELPHQCSTGLVNPYCLAQSTSP